MDKDFWKSIEEKPFDIKEEFFKYLPYWPWFLGAVIACYICSFFYLRYATIIYQANAEVKILDNSTNTFKMPTEGISLFARSKINLENEVEVFSSRRIIERVVDRLDLNTRYITEGYFKKIELWDKKPFKVKWLVSDDTLVSKNIGFKVKLLQQGYQLYDGKVLGSKLYPYNKPNTSQSIPFVLIPDSTSIFKSQIDRTFSVSLQPRASVVGAIKKSLRIENVGKQSEILLLTFSSEDPRKAEDILNEIVEQFNQDGIEDRQLISQRTIDFVNERLVYLTSELDSIETDKVRYKTDNQLTFLPTDTETTLANKSKTDLDYNDLLTQIELAKFLHETLRTDKKFTLLPEDIGINYETINGLVEQYNKLVLDRDKLLINAMDKSPVLEVVSKRIIELKENILSTLTLYESKLQISKNNLQRLKSQHQSQFSSIPAKEKRVRSIERQQGLKESLYLLLLQKREEALINKAITAPSIKVVDFAIASTTPVSPNRSAVYLVAFAMGLIIPLLVLYFLFSIDNKIHNRGDITQFINHIPIIAEIPYIDNELKLMSVNDRSVLAESFRVLRTNLHYLLPANLTKAPVIYVTSTIKGEGKTFTSLNLAMALATMKKKVVIVGSDMRNPQLHSYLGYSKDNIGLSNYLHDPRIDWKTIVNEAQLDNKYLDMIFAGPIPPNPAELLSNGRFEGLLEILKSNYDYVIVDTSPTILVTDTLIVSKLADITLYVIRADYTEKKLMYYTMELKFDNKMNNMAYVFNNVGLQKSYGYGYKYGYSYGYRYNYGYGYGYSADKPMQKLTFFKKWMSMLGLRKK